MGLRLNCPKRIKPKVIGYQSIFILYPLLSACSLNYRMLPCGYTPLAKLALYNYCKQTVQMMNKMRCLK